VELSHIRYFLVAAKLQNVTKAANCLYLTQPTLSHQIKQLEDELGCDLFDRVGRTVRLTQAGELFHEYAKRVLQEVDSAMEAIHDLGSLKHGKLTIGVFASFSSSGLPSILARFATTYPGIKITVLELPTGELEKRLREGELNFGIAYGSPEGDQIVSETLFEEHLALIVGPKHPLYDRESIEMGELSRHDLIMLTHEYVSRGLVETVFAMGGFKPRISMEMNSIQAVLETVRGSSLGAILSERLAGSISGLHSARFTPPIVRTVALFTRKNASRSAASDAMIEMIKSNF
jgi:LysR family cyn operon transcriptional activator